MNTLMCLLLSVLFANNQISSHYPTVEGKLLLQQNKPQFGLRAAENCPLEHSLDTALKNPTKSSFKIGDIATSKCDARGSRWSWDLANFPHKFLVYPSTNRTCLSNGTWSSPPPICAHLEDNKRSNRVEVHPANVTETLNKRAKNWRKIGRLHSKCHETIHSKVLKHRVKRSTANSEKQIFTRLYTFTRPEYFSFITIELPSGSDLIHFAVYAKSEDVISEMSDSALKFNAAHHDNYMTIQPSVDVGTKQCSTVELSVYSSQLVVHYAISTSKEHQPDLHDEGNDRRIDNVRFFAVLRKGASSGDNNKLNCPQKPLIAHAISSAKKSEPNVFVYACTGGRILVDPISNKLSNGIVRCSNGSWSPYPSPVCRSLVEL